MNIPMILVLLGIIGYLDAKIFFVSLILAGLMLMDWKDIISKFIKGGQDALKGQDALSELKETGGKE